MKRLFLALGICLTLSSSALSQGTIVGPGNLILCQTMGQMAVGPTTATIVVTGQANKTTAFCGWHITNTGATGTFTITAGQGAGCGTNTVTLVTVQSVTSTAPSTDHTQYATYSAPVGATPYNICVTPSVATIAATIYYVTF
jgi:hypothetical protein